MTDHNFKALLLTVVDVLKTQGLEAAGELDGLQAYAALQALKNEAQAFDVPMSEIGLSGFDIDALLHKPRKVA